jgi:hypothetical protein
VKLRVRLSGMRSGKTRLTAECADEGIECYAGGSVFAKGVADGRSHSTDEQEVKVMLAGQGGARGAGHVRLRKGDVVGVRAPFWHIDVDSEKWLVAVDWSVL